MRTIATVAAPHAANSPPVRPASSALQRWLRHSVSPLGLLVLLSFGPISPAAAQTAPRAERGPEQLDPVNVVPSRPRRPRQRATPAPAPTPVRTTARTRVRAPATAVVPATAPATETGPGGGAKTPLNTETVAESASILGLTPRQTPATVEIIDQQTLTDRGLHTTTEAAQAAVGVTAGDAPGAPASFSMRGFSGTQINTLYNGIKIGPSEMTGRIMDTGNLEQIEILKGPASLVSGEGATGGAINYVTKRPHTGKIVNDAFTSFDSFNGFRAGFGSGGSTTVKGLDYRFDIVRSSNISFIDDTYAKLLNISGQLDYRVTDNFKIWGAVERKEDKDRFYWGTPLVPVAFSGPYATSGVVSGLWTQYYPNGHTGFLARSRSTAAPSPPPTTCSTIAAERASCGCAAGSTGTSPTTSSSRAKSIRTRPNASGSTTRSTRSTTRRGCSRSIVSGCRSTIRRGSSATSPT